MFDKRLDNVNPAVQFLVIERNRHLGVCAVISDFPQRIQELAKRRRKNAEGATQRNPNRK